MLIKRSFIGLTILIALVVGCAQYDNDTGKSVVSGDFRGVIRDTLIPIDSCGFQVLGDINKISSSTLILGKQNGITSEIVLQFGRFYTLSDTAIIAGDTLDALDSTMMLDSVSWTGASLSLFATGFIEGDSSDYSGSAPLTFDIFKVNESISPVDLKYDVIQSSSLLGSDTLISALDTDSIEITLPLDSLYLDKIFDILQDTTWQTDTSFSSEFDTLTLQLKPKDNFNPLRKFGSRFGSSQDIIPLLNISAVYYFSDSTDQVEILDTTITIAATFSTYLVHDSLDLVSDPGFQNDRLLLSQGFSRRMLFWADIANVVDSMNTLNKVELWLNTEEGTENQLGETDQMEVFPGGNKWFDEPDDAALDLSFIPVFMAITEEQPDPRVDMTTFTKFWHAYPDSNNGFIIRALSETRTIGRRVFYGNAPTVPDSLRPKIRLIYTEYNLP